MSMSDVSRTRQAASRDLVTPLQFNTNRPISSADVAFVASLSTVKEFVWISRHLDAERAAR